MDDSSEKQIDFHLGLTFECRIGSHRGMSVDCIFLFCLCLDRVPRVSSTHFLTTFHYCTVLDLLRCGGCCGVVKGTCQFKFNSRTICCSSCETFHSHLSEVSSTRHLVRILQRFDWSKNYESIGQVKKTSKRFLLDGLFMVSVNSEQGLLARDMSSRLLFLYQVRRLESVGKIKPVGRL